MGVKYSSIRSILRGGNTPATGQSIRFFSRDAYRVMTPDGSATREGESLFPDNLGVNEADHQAALTFGLARPPPGLGTRPVPACIEPIIFTGFA